jgi:hypothetical protein
VVLSSQLVSIVAPATPCPPFGRRILTATRLFRVGLLLETVAVR